jgi:replication factor C subunit 2/4
MDSDSDSYSDISDITIKNETKHIAEIFEDNLNDENILRSRYKNPKLNGKDEIPWVEKYRPRKLDDIIEQDEIVKVLKNTLKTGELPHLLLFGPPGTGKTSTILAIAMQLFGPNIIHNRVMELNASDDRGIGIVRNNILTFAKFSIGSKDPEYPCPDFKIVILDEADSMTPEAQAALRKVMEKMSGITRFCFICNYINQILDPISSRCMKFRFKPIEKSAIIKKLKTISKIENIDVNDDCINTIVNISDGDVRRSIMTLQNMKYVTKYKNTITPKDIVELTGGIDTSVLKNFWKTCCEGNVHELRNMSLFIYREGFPLGNILTFMRDCILKSDISDIKKSKISIEISKSDRKIIEGCDEYLQILNILLQTNKIIKENKKN